MRRILAWLENAIDRLRIRIALRHSNEEEWKPWREVLHSRDDDRNP